MTSQLNTLLATVLTDDQQRSARNHRSSRIHTYALPVVREIRDRRDSTSSGPSAAGATH